MNYNKKTVRDIDVKGKKVLCIITGGNIDLDKFCKVCEAEYPPRV